MSHINAIFDNMDRWRNLPAYQLERRADIFFSIYLPEILSYKLGVKVEGIIPEFPVRVGTIDDNSSNQSFKVDYLIKASDKIILVELKTDQGSRRDEQDEYLKEAQGKKLAILLDGVLQIYKATKSKKKYEYLLGLLQDLGFIIINEAGTFEITQAIAPTDDDIQIVYIQPNNPDPDKQDVVITFQEVSEIIEKHGDELSLRFSESLLKWADTKAGENKKLPKKETCMKINEIAQRLQKNRPTTMVSIRIPDDVIDDLKRVAPMLGFSGYQALIKAYIGQGLRADRERLDNSVEFSAFIEQLRKKGVQEEIISSAMAEAHSVE